MTSLSPDHDPEPCSCLDRRRAGVVLHVTSLPGAGGMGADARRFVDLLADCGLGVWQTLPVGPTHEDGSPYQSTSVHAGNASFINAEELVAAGWLAPGQAVGGKGMLPRAWHGFQQQASEHERVELDEFIRTHGYWLEDYALFKALRRANSWRPWWEWPAPLRDHDRQALELHRRRLRTTLDELYFEQFVFFRQWRALKDYANGRGVRLFGDMPIFVAHDSAEVWARRDWFELDPQGAPTVVAGVPPDYFSATGQRWGNPLYRWDRLKDDGFSFWVERLGTQLTLFDLVRIDHFRGFEAYWEIPAREPDAVNGRWIKAPGEALFDTLRAAYRPLPVIAEDLGVITPEVEALRDRYGLPGMKILQFAFSGGSDNPYLPHNIPRNAVVYTGTHDNDTTLGWYEGLDEPTRDQVNEYLGFPGEDMPWPMIRCALASRARLAMLPMQDMIALDSSHRMNLPGTTAGNWSWRFEWAQVPDDLVPRMRRMLELYGRL